MKPRLLDANVVIALLWETHIHHRSAHAWFDKHRGAGFRTCPITQAAAIRILSNPHFGRDHPTIAEAQEALNDLLDLPEHEFWPDDLQVGEALAEIGWLTGHRQITDAYLLALAKAHGGVLATFDRGVLALRGAAQHAELISY